MPRDIFQRTREARALQQELPFATLRSTKVPQEGQAAVAGPSFLEALFGIAINGSPWEYMLQMKRQGYDGIVPVDLKFAGKYNFLLSPESVRAATVEEAKLLPRRFSVPLFETLELDRGIVYEQGERHKRNKKICIPSFEQARSMESFVEATKAELDDLSEEFRAKAAGSNGAVSSTESNNKIDLYAEMRRSALNVVLDVSFGLGKEGASNFQKADELSSTIAEYLERIVALANEIPPLWQISPRLSYNYVRVTDVVLPKLRALVSEVIEARRAEGAEAQAKRNRADLLGVLVEELEDNADIRSILFDVVIAGSDTTASTATAGIYLLHQPENKDWLEKARAEAIETVAGRDVPLDKIRSTMPVCVSIAREVLRLYPPVPFVGRTATGSGKLLSSRSGGQESYPVEPGDTFCFSPWYLGRDPSQWGETAGTFDPQRWLDDGASGGAPNTFSWLPFGAGARGCLGTRLGLTEVTLGIARLLKDFEFDFETKGPLPVRYDLTLNLDGVMDCTIRNRSEMDA